VRIPDPSLKERGSSFLLGAQRRSNLLLELDEATRGET
jgi:hypothetical protein